jgi:hypothetical protein
MFHFLCLLVLSYVVGEALLNLAFPARADGVEKRIRQLDAPPRVPLFRRIVAGAKYELDLLRHYKYARHQSGSRRLF